MRLQLHDRFAGIVIENENTGFDFTHAPRSICGERFELIGNGDQGAIGDGVFGRRLSSVVGHELTHAARGIIDDGHSHTFSFRGKGGGSRPGKGQGEIGCWTMSNDLSL